MHRTRISFTAYSEYNAIYTALFRECTKRQLRFFATGKSDYRGSCAANKSPTCVVVPQSSVDAPLCLDCVRRSLPMFYTRYPVLNFWYRFAFDLVNENDTALSYTDKMDGFRLTKQYRKIVHVFSQTQHRNRCRCVRVYFEAILLICGHLTSASFYSAAHSENLAPTSPVTLTQAIIQRSS